MAAKRKIQKRYKLTNKALDAYWAKFKDEHGRLIIEHNDSLPPQVVELIKGALEKWNPLDKKGYLSYLNKKDFLFVSRELARYDIETREKTDGILFSWLLPPQEIVRSGEAARARALQLFYKDVEAIMVRDSRDPHAYMVDFRRFVDVEQRHRFFGLPAFCRQEGLSWAKFRRGESPPGGRRRLVNEWREYADTMRRNMLYMMELVREKIILDNIALFGPPQVDAPSYGGIVRIENAGSIPEKDLSELKTNLLSFQALTAPTTNRAQLDVTVRYKVLDKKTKRDEGASFIKYTAHYSSYDKSVNLFKHQGDDYNASKRVVYHEMMHAVDYAAPGLMRQTFAFLETRCGIVPCEDIEFYPELIMSRGDRAFGLRDSFISAYTGRVYLHDLHDPNHEFDPYEWNSTEVSTTSIDQFACPETMLSLLSNDPKLFSHALAICYGTYFDFNPERP
jgi:hypothetical protein